MSPAEPPEHDRAALLEHDRATQLERDRASLEHDRAAQLERDRAALEHDRASLLERLRSILVTEFELDPAQVTGTARLVEDLDLDSIDGVTIVVRLEAQLHVTISDEEIQKMATVGDIVDALADRLAAPQCP